MEDISFANQCACDVENKTKTSTCSSECTCEKDRCCPKTKGTRHESNCLNEFVKNNWVLIS
jgi:hypothetical protein